MPEIVRPGLSVRFLRLVRHWAMGLLILAKGAIQGPRQLFGKYGAGDDAGVHPALGPLEINLAEI
jgi:hypothetical protein